jgi:hypothetical protein
MQTTVARWLIAHDPDATRRCYAQLPAGSGCDCSSCRNFEAALGQTFPDEFLHLLGTLGVDPTKQAELCHYCREGSGLHLTGGWYHLVGSIVAGDDACRRENGASTFWFEEFRPGFEFGFSARLALVQHVFTGLPLVQLEFQTRVPWVITDSEPQI